MNLKIEQVESGQWGELLVWAYSRQYEEGEMFEEFWRSRADELGLDAAKPNTDSGEDGSESDDDS